MAHTWSNKPPRGKPYRKWWLTIIPRKFGNVFIDDVDALEYSAPVRVIFRWTVWVWLGRRYREYREYSTLPTP